MKSIIVILNIIIVVIIIVVVIVIMIIMFYLFFKFNGLKAVWNNTICFSSSVSDLEPDMKVAQIWFEKIRFHVICAVHSH